MRVLSGAVAPMSDEPPAERSQQQPDHRRPTCQPHTQLVIRVRVTANPKRNRGDQRHRNRKRKHDGYRRPKASRRHRAAAGARWQICHERIEFRVRLGRKRNPSRPSNSSVSSRPSTAARRRRSATRWRSVSDALKFRPLGHAAVAPQPAEVSRLGHTIPRCTQPQAALELLCFSRARNRDRLLPVGYVHQRGVGARIRPVGAGPGLEKADHAKRRRIDLP